MRSVLSRRLLAPLAAPFLLTVFTPLAAAQPRPFEIKDSIGMTVLNDANSSMLNSSTIELSPDGRWFFVVTKKGDLQKGTNIFTLLLYNAEEVRKGIATPGLPPARTMASFASSSNRNGIDQPRWASDSGSIVFLAEKPGEVPQVYQLDIPSGRLRKLTSHPTPVTAFDMRPDTDRFVYAADAEDPGASARERGYEVGKLGLFDVMKGKATFSRTTSFFRGNRKSSKVRPLELVPQVNVGRGLWLSPHGRYAIFPRHVAEPDLSWWRDYGPPSQPPFDKATDPALTSFATPNPAVFLQFYLLDLETGKGRPLLDAPTGFLFAGFGLDAHWAEDGESVVLSNTFLPLEGVQSSEELSRRKASPAIVEVDLRTGAVSRLVDLLLPRNGQTPPPRPFSGSTQTTGGDIIAHWNNPDPAARLSAYRKGAGGWAEIDSGVVQKRAEASISVMVTQGLNQPPELKATDLAKGDSETITDLNPQLRDVVMGKVEPIEGMDEDGQTWRAGLLKPFGYQPGKRYPLVIQTHGFDPGTFLVDGPFGSTAGYAARALAGRDIMVLQLQDVVPPYGAPDEPVRAMKQVLAAIHMLDKAGLVDMKRIGIHGFSRTGLVVQEALVNSGFPFAAASVADANSRSVLMYLMLFGQGYPSMMDTEGLIGAPLWGSENARLWAEQDPTFHLDRVCTPLKIDAYSAPTWFTTFAILRRHQKPVDYWAYPDSVHNPVKPWQRLTTQGGTVDWYDFWLNGREDPDSTKAEQYKRWRKLRTQHDADIVAR